MKTKLHLILLLSNDKNEKKRSNKNLRKCIGHTESVKDTLCTYQMIQKEFIIGYAAIHNYF